MSAPKSAPVLLPNAKKPSLLMRLFSTERKSSIYVMPSSSTSTPSADSDGAAAGSGCDKTQQQKRQMQRLKSVDSVTMERDREALRKQQQQQSKQRHRRDGEPQRDHKRIQQTPSAPPADKPRKPSDSSSSSSPPSSPQNLPPQKSSEAVDSRPPLARPCSVAAASGTASDDVTSGAQKQRPSQPELKIQPQKAAPTEKPTPSPTETDKTPPISNSDGNASGQRKQSLTTKHKSPPTSPEAETPSPIVPPTSQNGGKPEVTSKKRSSMSAESAQAPSVNEHQRPRKATSKNRKTRNLKHRKRRTPKSGEIKVDVTKPLEFPTTPDIISEYHRQKPFLNHNEEWLIVELLEYECLIDGLEIIRIIAKHSKFFELEPDELWEEFFEFVENVPSYDEIINYDVWQEFLLEKYNC